VKGIIPRIGSRGVTVPWAASVRAEASSKLVKIRTGLLII